VCAVSARFTALRHGWLAPDPMLPLVFFCVPKSTPRALQPQRCHLPPRLSAWLKNRSCSDLRASSDLFYCFPNKPALFVMLQGYVEQVFIQKQFDFQR
jgi:hypothetical protein